jgi:iron(III) transport system substrate-binding protein
MAMRMRPRHGWSGLLTGMALLVAGCGGQQAATSPAAPSSPAAASPSAAAKPSTAASAGASAAAKPSGAANGVAAPAKPGGAASGASAAAGSSAALDQLYQAAKQEGSVMASLSWQDDQFLPLQKAFTARFPGIKFDRLEISPNKGLERVITEKAAGKTSTDVAGARMLEIKQAIDRDLAASYDFAGTFGLPKEGVLEDNRYVVDYHNASLLTYNTKLLDDNSAPKTWEDLTDPRFQGGKIILAQDAADVFWALGQDWGKDKMLQYAQQIHDQKPRLAQSSSEVTNLLIAGDAQVAMSIYASSYLKYTKKGAPLKATSASPVSVDNNGVFVLKDAPHPNAARLLAGWLSTPEAQKVFYDSTFRSLLFPGVDTGHAQLVKDLGVKLIFEDPAKEDENTAMQKQAMNIVLGKSS